eukprot:3922246-Ditylum_brightwellii.AAC.1
MKSLNRAQLAVVKKGEEEILYDRNPDQQMVVDGHLDGHYNNNDDDDDKDTEKNSSANTSKKKETALTKSIQLFCEQSDDTIASATSFMYEYIWQKQAKSIAYLIMMKSRFSKASTGAT